MVSEAGAYCASKSAVNALFESMRLTEYNIKVSIIRPGYIQTPLTIAMNFTCHFTVHLNWHKKSLMPFNANKKSMPSLIF